MLVNAYTRRKQFEARLIAIEVAKIFSGSSGTATSSNASGSSPDESPTRFYTKSGKSVEMIPPRVMLDQLGVKLDF